jgi:hypothetical protein
MKFKSIHNYIIFLVFPSTRFFLNLHILIRECIVYNQNTQINFVKSWLEIPPPSPHIHNIYFNRRIPIHQILTQYVRSFFVLITMHQLCINTNVQSFNKLSYNMLMVVGPAASNAYVVFFL